MIVGRRVDGSVTRLPTVSISKDHRRLIEYWKIRVKCTYPRDLVAPQRLSEAFQAANADQEALEFWRECRNVTRYTSSRMASAICARKKDYIGLYEWCKSCQEIYFAEETWEALKELRTHTSDSERNSKRDFIDLLKAALMDSPCDASLAGILVEESKAHTQVSDRIKTLRSGLEHMGEHVRSDDWGTAPDLNDSQKLIVEELEKLVWRQGDEENAVTFWKVMVRKLPNSWYVGRALQNAFGRRGEYPEAVEFWRRIKRSQASYQSDYFYAESCQETGDLEEAIKFWFIWMEFIITDHDSDGDEWPIVQAAESLQQALLFNHEPWEVVQFWQRSLGRSSPSKRHGDIRQEYIASTYSNAPELKSDPDSDEIVKTVAAWCAYDDRIATSLRADLERRGIPEIEFWKSLQDAPRTARLLRWYGFRLAQYYSLREEFTLAQDTVYRIVVDWHGEDDDLRRALIQLDLGCYSRKFWLKAVENTPNLNTVRMLEDVCESQEQSSAIEMWKYLIQQYPAVGHFSNALENAFRAQSKPETWNLSHQIEFWKHCFTSFPEYMGGTWGLETALELRREEPGLPISASSFDEEIEAWFEILRVPGVAEKSIGLIVLLLRGALEKKANAVEYSDIQTSVQICKEAAEIWTTLISDYWFSQITTQLQKYREDALTMLKVLETAD